jgi:hypothetical protein
MATTSSRGIVNVENSSWVVSISDPLSDLLGLKRDERHCSALSSALDDLTRRRDLAGIIPTWEPTLSAELAGLLQEVGCSRDRSSGSLYGHLSFSSSVPGPDRQ